MYRLNIESMLNAVRNVIEEENIEKWHSTNRAAGQKKTHTTATRNTRHLPEHKKTKKENETPKRMKLCTLK